MRILHFLWGLAQGGAENLAVDLANAHSHEHEVTVYVGNESIDAGLLHRLNSSIRFVHLKRPEGSRNPLWIARLLTCIHGLRPDVIHSHAGNLSTLASFIAAPIILTVHTNNVRLLKSASRFAAICCISSSVKEDIRARYPHLSPRLIVNGINTSAIPLHRSPPSWPLRAVQVSRLVHETKGQDLLIKALAAINGSGNGPRLIVDFIGSGSSLTYLTELAAACGVSNCCNFLGTKLREEVFTSLQHYDLLVQPSREEGFGLTVAEGMAAGIPVIVSDLAGPMEVIGQGRHGYHFRNGDVNALVTALCNAISDINAGALESRLAAARQSVIEQFDLTRTSADYLHVYEEVINAC